MTLDVNIDLPELDPISPDDPRFFRSRPVRLYSDPKVFPKGTGEWVILSYAKTKCVCQCSCGTIRKVTTRNLVMGKSRSCGCKRIDGIRKAKCPTGKPLSHTKEYRRQYVLKNYDKHLYDKCKARCKKDGITFNLTPDDIKIPNKCPVLGIKLKPSIKGISENNPTIDRIIPSLGYVKGNIVVVSWRANRLKSNASFDEIRRLYEFYAKKQGVLL